MAKLILIIATVCIGSPSFGQNKIETIKAHAYYDSVSYQYQQSRNLQQRLIVKMTEAVLTIKNDNAAVVNNQELQLLFDSAKTKNEIALSNIEKITEVDNDINYKSKVIDYLSGFQSFYDNEMRDLIILLGQKSGDRFTKSAELLGPKLQLIKDKEIEFKNAQEIFKAKYPIGTDGSARTSLEYELVKFSEYKYTQAVIREGEEISILSFSGGEDCETDKKYYKQFIGIVKSTGDTIRIIAPCQVYDINKPVRIGYYHKAIPDIPLNITGSNSFIVFNKHQRRIEKKDFKTAIGMLTF